MNDVLRRLREARMFRPYTLAFSVILPVPGALAIIYGDDVSQALSNIAAGVMSRIVGVALMVGALLTLTGVARGKSLIEASGLTIMAGGCATYGLGVLLGLGLAGAIAGPGFLAISIGTALRVASLATVAREVDSAGGS